MSKDPTMSGDELDKYLEETVSRLMEHLDSVQLIGIRSLNGEPIMFYHGGGSYYERKGAVHEWVSRDEAKIKAHYMNEGEPPDGEDWKDQVAK